VNKKPSYQAEQVSKIYESYNTDKGPDSLNFKDDSNDQKSSIPEMPSESSSMYSLRVNIYYII